MPTAATKVQALASFKMDPTRLNAAVARGFRASVDATAVDATAHAPASTVRAIPTVRGKVGYVRGIGPLAHLFEGGVQPHIVAPGGVASARSTSRRLAVQGPALTGADIGKGRVRVTAVRKRRGGKKAMAGDLEHPISIPIPHPGMRPQPFLAPAAERWAAGAGRLVMRSYLSSAGFR